MQRESLVIANLFHCMKYMERRGSGLRKIVREIEKLPGYVAAYNPKISSTATGFTDGMSIDADILVEGICPKNRRMMQA